MSEIGKSEPDNDTKIKKWRQAASTAEKLGKKNVSA
jgi:hypothetical protein